jgi:uncharacterized membrane protein
MIEQSDKIAWLFLLAVWLGWVSFIMVMLTCVCAYCDRQGIMSIVEQNEWHWFPAIGVIALVVCGIVARYYRKSINQ